VDPFSLLPPRQETGMDALVHAISVMFIATPSRTFLAEKGDSWIINTFHGDEEAISARYFMSLAATRGMALRRLGLFMPLLSQTGYRYPSVLTPSCFLDEYNLPSSKNAGIAHSWAKRESFHLRGCSAVSGSCGRTP
jgi:hypothetical protein